MTRQVGPSGPQPISLSDIYALTQMTGIRKTDDLEFVLRVIPAMDQVYLDKTYEERAKEAEKAKKAAAGKTPRRGRRGR